MATDRPHDSGDPEVAPEFNPPPVRGLFATTYANRAHLVGWDFAAAVVLTIAGVELVHTSVLVTALPDLLPAEFGLVGAVIGVVIAGLAIVVAFLSSDYAKVIVRSEEGAMGDYWPFWFVAAIAALAVVAAGVGLILIAQAPGLRRTVFGVTTFLSSYAIFGTVDLVASVALQGETRAWDLATRKVEESDAK